MRIARLALLATLVLTACRHTFSITPPSPSRLALELPADPPAIAISLVDERPAAGRIFLVWDSFGSYAVEAEPRTDPAQFFAEHTQAELVSRGLPVKIAVGNGGLPRIHLRTFRLRGYREKVWTPTSYEEIAVRVLISADLETAAGRRRIGVFTTGRDKPRSGLNNGVPEVVATEVEATSQPLAMAMKEFATKLADQLYGYRSSDEAVEELARLIGPPLNLDSYRDIYALGFTNNPSAIPLLSRIAGAPELLNGDPGRSTRVYLEPRVRDAAVASLGTVRATSQLALLQSFVEERRFGWRTPCLAAKSIGDLGTKEALDYLDALMKSGTISPASERGGFLAQVIELYR